MRGRASHFQSIRGARAGIWMLSLAVGLSAGCSKRTPDPGAVPASAPPTASVEAPVSSAPHAAPSAKPAEPPAPLKKAPSFELRDAFGNLHRSADLFQGKKLLLVLFVGCECPMIQLYAERMEKFAKEFGPRGLAMVGVNANAQDSLQEIQQWTKQTKISFPILKDAGAEVADRFTASRTPEAFLIDGAGRVYYQGRIDDQFDVGARRTAPERSFLRDAVEAALQGKTPEPAYTRAVGCLIGRPPKASAKSSVTYCGAISRLLNRRCLECHRVGEIAPFPLGRYEDVVGWAPMIKEVVSNGRMPPWGADPHYGQFRDAPLLSDSEKSELFTWIDGGCPEGNPSELPPPPEFPIGWRIPQPDEVFYISDKPVAVDANGPIPYKTFFVPMNNKDEKWIQAAEIRPGDRRVVHHASFWVLGPETEDDNYNRPPNFPFTPGTPPLQLPEGCAIRVPPGSRLRMQMHYEPIGAAAEDRSCIGLRYIDASKVKGQVVYDSVFPLQQISVPPGDPNSAAVGRHYFARDAVLLALLPHLHVRGKAFKFTLQTPDGSRRTILDVPRYEFEWQFLYSFAEPLKVPAGSVMFCDGVFDNSPANPDNPDPKVKVQWGPQTFDEMLVGFMIGMDPTCTPQNAGAFRFPEEAFGAPLHRQWKLRAHERSAKMTEPKDVEGTVSVQIEPTPGAKPWTVQLTRNLIPLKKGASYWVSLRARASKPQKAMIGVNRSTAPFTSVGLYRELELTTNWQTRHLPFTATEDDDQPVIRFDLGQTDGTVELEKVVFLQGAHRF